jgi:hypothetical protein
MELLILLFVLLLFLVFASWDHDRIDIEAKQAAKQRRQGTGVLPRALISTPSLLIVAAVLGVTAVALVVQPPTPPFTGRGSWVTALLHAALGQYGPAMTLVALALACLLVAIARFTKRAA